MLEFLKKLFGLKDSGEVPVKEEVTVEECRRVYRERKKKITDYLSEYRKKESDERELEYKKSLEECRKKNSVCPKCGANSIIHNIKRTKGEVHGEGKFSHTSRSSGGFLWGSASSYAQGSSKVDGEMDTYPVNKCTVCGHEWFIENAERPKSRSIFSDYETSCPGFLARNYLRYVELKYNPDDIREECDSLEEKQDALIETMSRRLKCYSEVPRYMVEYAYYKGSSPYSEIRREDHGISEEDDEYSYVFPEEKWEVIKKLIGWKGTE